MLVGVFGAFAAGRVCHRSQEPRDRRGRHHAPHPAQERPDHAPLRPNLRPVDPQCHHRREPLIAATPAVLARRAIAAKLDWTDTRLRFDWVVDVREPVDVKRLHGEVAGVLEQLERLGVDSVIVGSEVKNSAELTLEKVGIRIAYRLNSSRTERYYHDWFGICGGQHGPGNDRGRRSGSRRPAGQPQEASEGIRSIRATSTRLGSCRLPRRNCCPSLAPLAERTPTP